MRSCRAKNRHAASRRPLAGIKNTNNSKRNIPVKLIETLFIILLVNCLVSCGNISVPDSPYPISNDSFTVNTIAEGFTIPYGIAIENEYFITDRAGKMPSL